MDLNTFITALFCLADDWLREQEPPRRRGPAPELSDSEVLTIEIVGEFLGIDAEKGLYTYFRRTTVSGSLPSVGSTAPLSPARWPTFGC